MTTGLPERRKEPPNEALSMSTISNWDDAYANTPHIAGGASYPARWSTRAKAFRDEIVAARRGELDLAYGEAERERLDLFHPTGVAKGLTIFAHGGYWMAFDKSSWSHLAAGALSRGWAVCLPSYTLTPQARITTITQQFAAAVRFAAGLVAGPLRLAGHSAGGHLVTRMVCEDSPLSAALRSRIDHVISISGLHDLRPLLRTQMNTTLRLDRGEAERESAALREPLAICPMTCWVGGAERPEFIRQSQLLANIWSGLGAVVDCAIADGRHHFNVIDDLIDPQSRLNETWLSE
jgi:acetyl esterase/lipase